VSRRYHNLPSLTALVAFEASARHLSFKQAANELHITPGAISKQIRTIEDELGVPLFVRLEAGITLTSAGQDLFGVLSNSFVRTAEVVGSIKRGDRSKNVTMACTDAFATYWLIPRMPDFWTRFPEITVDHLISDDPREFRRAEVELLVRYGFGAWSGETAELLFGDTIYPVCGPNFARKYRRAQAKDLPDLPLLHVDWVDPEWANWEEVFCRANIAHGRQRGRRFGKYSVAVQAAQADQGVVLGWDRLVRQLVQDGRLRRFTDLELPAPGGYYVTLNDYKTLSPAGVTLRNWLREMSKLDEGVKGRSDA
jgi:LysR family transcriptional regulator, glycine cleavage system transcriptional activator